MHQVPRTASLLAALSLAWADVAPAQARVRLFGKVVDEGGREIPGARVFLVSWPVRYMQVGEVDRIEVASGERGRFEAMVLDGRAYTVWGQIADAGETVTPADGTFHLHAAGVAGTYRVNAGHRSAEGWTVSGAVPFAVDPERPTVPELRLALPPASPTGPSRAARRAGRHGRRQHAGDAAASRVGAVRRRLPVRG